MPADAMRRVISMCSKIALLAAPRLRRNCWKSFTAHGPGQWTQSIPNKRIEERAASVLRQSIKQPGLAQCLLTTDGVALLICLMGASESGVGVSVGSGLSVLDRAGRWLVVKLCANRLRRGRSDNRV